MLWFARSRFVLWRNLAHGIGPSHLPIVVANLRWAVLDFDAVIVSNDRIYPALKKLAPDLKVENWASN